MVETNMFNVHAFAILTKAKTSKPQKTILSCKPVSKVHLRKWNILWISQKIFPYWLIVFMVFRQYSCRLMWREALKISPAPLALYCFSLLCNLFYCLLLGFDFFFTVYSCFWLLCTMLMFCTALVHSVLQYFLMFITASQWFVKLFLVSHCSALLWTGLHCFALHCELCCFALWSKLHFSAPIERHEKTLLLLALQSIAEHFAHSTLHIPLCTLHFWHSTGRMEKPLLLITAQSIERCIFLSLLVVTSIRVSFMDLFLV